MSQSLEEHRARRAAMRRGSLWLVACSAVGALVLLASVVWRAACEPPPPEALFERERTRWLALVEAVRFAEVAAVEDSGRNEAVREWVAPRGLAPGAPSPRLGRFSDPRTNGIVFRYGEHPRISDMSTHPAWNNDDAGCFAAARARLLGVVGIDSMPRYSEHVPSDDCVAALDRTRYALIVNTNSTRAALFDLLARNRVVSIPLTSDEPSAVASALRAAVPTATLEADAIQVAHQ